MDITNKTQQARASPGRLLPCPIAYIICDREWHCIYILQNLIVSCILVIYYGLLWLIVANNCTHANRLNRLASVNEY